MNKSFEADAKAASTFEELKEVVIDMARDIDDIQNYGCDKGCENRNEDDYE